MKHKKTLPIIFFIIMFISRPVLASAITLPAEKASLIDATSGNTNILNDIAVYTYPLTSTGELLHPDNPILCSYPNDIGAYGCGNMDSDNDGFAQEIEYIDNDEDYEYYLKDVIAVEMNLAQITPDPESEALKAQAIASRTLVNWKSAKMPWMEQGSVNNSTKYQVFMPGAYNNSNYKSAIDKAVDETKGQFLQYLYFDDSHTIDAEFGADMQERTKTEYPDPSLPPDPNWVAKPYLTGVEDPISKSCIVDVSGSHDYGMSQRGAIRWAKGNECPEGTGAVWPVTWSDYRQILAHYYTGIDILDGSGTKIAPDDRWNLISHDIPLNADRIQPARFAEGGRMNASTNHSYERQGSEP
jgi:hypothetical protein